MGARGPRLDDKLVRAYGFGVFWCFHFNVMLLYISIGFSSLLINTAFEIMCKYKGIVYQLIIKLTRSISFLRGGCWRE